MAQKSHFKLVKPAYPAERVDSWAHSLEDPTVEQSVIDGRMKWVHDKTVDIMIVNKGRAIKIIRYKK